MNADPLEIVASTADAAFATDESGRVVIWNKAAERLLGHEAGAVLGKPCHDLICGRDVFGNRFCDEGCPLHHMVRRHEAVRGFEMEVRKESGARARMRVSVMSIPGPKPSQYTLVHLLVPLAPREGQAVAEPALAAAGAEDLGQSPPADLRSLTGREVEVLRVLSQGLGTQDIADTLYISVATVRNHIQNILRKLGVHSKVEAVSLALRHRLI